MPAPSQRLVVALVARGELFSTQLWIPTFATQPSTQYSPTGRFSRPHNQLPYGAIYNITFTPSGEVEPAGACLTRLSSLSPLP